MFSIVSPEGIVQVFGMILQRGVAGGQDEADSNAGLRACGGIGFRYPSHNPILFSVGNE
jgi:hypothetical protein